MHAKMKVAEIDVFPISNALPMGYARQGEGSRDWLFSNLQRIAFAMRLIPEPFSTQA